MLCRPASLSSCPCGNELVGVVGALRRAPVVPRYSLSSAARAAWQVVHDHVEDGGGRGGERLEDDCAVGLREPLGVAAGMGCDGDATAVVVLVEGVQ